MTNTAAAHEAIKNMCAGRTTENLLAALAEIDAQPAEAGGRMVSAIISDTITEREGIDALVEQIYMDLDYEGTYTEAIIQALAMRDAA